MADAAGEYDNGAAAGIGVVQNLLGKRTIALNGPA
jgi:hypothetical protein